MPIIGLTDRDSILPRFPEVGRLHKGEKKKPNAPGRELAYFRFTSGIPGVEDIFKQRYGPEPSALRVLMPYGTMEENLTTSIELWTGSRMLWRADGQRTIRRWLPDKGVYTDREEDQIAMPSNPDARSTARLTVLLPELIEAGYPGAVLLASTSTYDCVNLTANLLEGEARANRAERNLTEIEFVLFRAQKMISTPDKSKKYMHWLCYLRPSEEWVRAQIAAARAAAYSMLPPGETIPTLPAPAGGSYTDQARNGTRQRTHVLTSEDEIPPDIQKVPPPQAPPPPDANDKPPKEPPKGPPEDFTELYTRVIAGELPYYLEGKVKGKKQAAEVRAHVAGFLRKAFAGQLVTPVDAWKALVEHDAEKRGVVLDDPEDKPPPLTEEDDDMGRLDVDGYEIASITGTEWSDFWLSLDDAAPLDENALVEWTYLAKLATKLGFYAINDENGEEAGRAVCEYLEVSPF